MGTNLIHIANRVAFNHISISYRQYFNKYMRLDSPLRKLVEKDTDLVTPDMNSTDEEYKVFYAAIANKLLEPSVVSKVRQMNMRPQEKIPIMTFKSVPLLDSILMFAKDIVHKFDSNLESRIKMKYKR